MSFVASLRRVVIVAALLALAPAPARALPAPKMHDLGGELPAGSQPPQLRDVGLTEHLGDTLPLDVKLTNQDGQEVTLGSLLGHERPVIFNLGYYGCPMLCGLVIKGLTDSLTALSYTPGTQFDLVTFSIDPAEGPALAAQKRKIVLETLNRPGAERGWSFHTSTAAESERLADALGFSYHYDPKTKQWNHAAAIVVVTPDGRISRYLYGIAFEPSDLKLAVLEASAGKVGSLADRALLYCYTYDATAGRYVLFAQNLMRAGGLLTLVGMAAFFFVQWRSSRNHAAPEPTALVKDRV